VKVRVGPLEVGWEIGPWIRWGGSEVGVGSYYCTGIETIPYYDEEGIARQVLYQSTPRNGEPWRVSRRPAINGDRLVSLSLPGGRTVYLRRPPHPPLL